MELHELNVLQGGPCTGCDGHAVAAAIRRADGILPDASGTTCRKDGSFGVNLLNFTCFLVDNLGTDALLGLAVSFADQVLDVAVFQVVNVLLLVEFGQESTHDFLAGKVCGMQNAVVAVASFQVQVKLRLVRGVRSKEYAPFYQLFDGVWTALGQDVHGFFLAKASACFQSVRDMEFELVRLLGNGGDATLGVVRGAVGLCSLGENDYRKPLLGGMQGGGKARNSCTKY